MSCIFALYNVVYSQNEHYLATRIKPGDICYRDGGVERFIGYRDWDSSNPPGVPIGVVFFSFYGPYPPGTNGEVGWHGWLIDIGESDSCVWAPTNTICYNNCVASYAVEGIDTPYNPHYYVQNTALADTCGWQNTYRILEFIYTGQGEVLSDNTSPVLRYIFAVKNGVTNFSVKPTMQAKSWYLPSLCQLRMAYGEIGPVNMALAACGGALMTQDHTWHSSTENNEASDAVWGVNGKGVAPRANMEKKDLYRRVKAVRQF